MTPEMFELFFCKPYIILCIFLNFDGSIKIHELPVHYYDCKVYIVGKEPLYFIYMPCTDALSYQEVDCSG